MPNPKSWYAPEFKAEAVRLAKQGDRSITQTAKDLGVSLETLRKRIKQAELDAGERHDGLTTEEREELRRLRRENRMLKEEKEILIKAAAFFVKETDSRRPGHSSCSSERRRITPLPRGAGCLPQRLLGVAKARAIATSTSRCRGEREGDPDSPGEPTDVRGAAHSGRAAG